MRRLFFASTVLFWFAVAGFWVAARWWPDRGAAVATTAERHYVLADVARHAGADDCWMAIDGQVYDLTAYLPQHPAPPAVLLAWCGREATQAYRTKGRGRPHSAYADGLLPAYRIGTLDAGR